jgi:Tfp pilus assembly protein FimT
MKVSRYKLVCGLTLLELVLVMVIICTILATAAPSLRGFFTSRETSDAAAQIVALTHLARSQAITEGRVYRLNLDTENKTYWLTVQEQGGFRQLYNDFGRVFKLPKDTEIELEDVSEYGESGYIDFNAQGQTQTGTIRLINRRGDVFEITCLSPAELYRVVVPEKI